MRATMDKTEKREWIIMEKEGQQIFGVLHRPVDVENPPVVVILHGFASSKHGSNRCYVNLAHALAKAGFAALRFDSRGSGDSEGNLSDITFEDLVSDAAFVIKSVGEIDGVDSSRMALFGASLGGSLAILAAERTQCVKAMALWAPAASGELWFRDYLARHPEHMNVEPGKLLATYKGNQIHPLFREQFAKLQAYKSMANLHDLPILHMHGEKDVTISSAHAAAFKNACPPDQSNVQFLSYPDGEHSLGYSSSFKNVIEETIRFFERNL